MSMRDLGAGVARVFSCWPSRVGAASLLALALSWATDEGSGSSKAERPAPADARPG